MLHPFAVVSYPRPPSFLPFHSKPIPPGGNGLPPSKRRLIDDERPSLPPLPVSVSQADLVAKSPIAPPPSRKSNTCGHYVKHSSKLTLLLSGQREGTCVPHYANGDTIEGILAIARPTGVLAVDVKIEGRIYVEEVGGGGSVSVKTINTKIYSWSASASRSFPPRASFRYTIPSSYRDSSVGKDYPLPPSYSADLHGIPGFSVQIAYAVVVNLTLLREPSTLWRGVSNIRVPFRYSHRTRPTLAPPFPCSPHRTETPPCPHTLWMFKMKARKEDMPGIKVHVYLPSSSVCCQLEPIPFHITLFADERTLEPFAEYRPMPSSFLPISGSPSYASFESVQTHISSRKAAHKCPLKIRVHRTTIVDAGSAGLGLALESPTQSQSRSGRQIEAVRDLFTRSDVSHSSSTSGKPRWEKDKASMHSSHAIGQGIVHSASKRAKSVVWSGAIVIPPGEEGFSGGFEVNGLKVVDSVVLSIEPPPPLRSQYLPLNETIPIVLTSDSANSRAGIPVSNIR
ncbi:hypothetical protein LXA43DRAFT_239743 [Ganoderma leucocontextum]|nr:hypothetical protein LXA43DRAFT_239743 [Ganoderma leucocontextum]